MEFKSLIKINFIIIILCNTLKPIICGEKPALSDESADNGSFLVYDSDLVHLECNVTGDPKPNIIWSIYNSAEDKYDLIKCNSSYYICGEESLEIRNNPNDETYRCNACNIHGCISLTRTTRRYFMQIIGPTDGVRLGDNAFLECSITNQLHTNFYFNAYLIWFKHNSKNITIQKTEQLIKKLEYNNQLDVYNSKYYSFFFENFYKTYDFQKLKSSRNENNVLTFRNVTSNDAGWYTCLVNTMSSKGVHAKHFHLKVLSNPETTSVPTTTARKTNFQVDEKHSFILLCPWNKSYTSNISWYHNDRAVDCKNNKRILCTEFSVVIENVTASDAGTYTCSSDNAATDCCPIIEQFNVNVRVSALFELIKIRQGNQTATASSTVQFDCEIVTTQREFKIYWLKFTDKPNAMNILTKMELYEIEEFDRLQYFKLLQEFNITLLNVKSKTLKLSNIAVENEAWYACCISNTNYQEIKSAHLTVEYGPLFGERTENQVVYENHEFTMKCKVSGNPVPKLKWYHNGKDMLCDDLKPCTSDEILKTQVTRDMGGTYKCNASNLWGSVEHSFLLIVLNSYTIMLPHDLENVKLTSRPTDVGLLQHNMTIECSTDKPIFGIIVWLKIMQRNLSQEIINLISAAINIVMEEDPIVNHKFLIDILNITMFEIINYEKIKKQTTQLNLTNITSDDEAWYSCIIFKRKNTREMFFYTVGKNYKSLYLKVFNETAPKFTNILPAKHLEITAAETLKLKCSATGRPLPNITWYRNGTQLKCNERRIFCNHFQIEISNTTLNDSGSYKCKLNNIHGYIEHEMIIQMLSRPSHTGIIITIVVLLLIVLSFVLYMFVKKYIKKQIILQTPEQTVHKWTKVVVVKWPETYVPENECESITPIIEIEEQKGKPPRCAEEEYLYEHNAQWEILRSNIVLGDILGEGSFGRVNIGYSTHLRSTNGSPVEIVAVKMLKEDPTENDVKNLVHELEIMKLLGNHINVLSFLGCCSQNGPLWVVVEYMPRGNLKNFLQKYKNNLAVDHIDETFDDLETTAAERINLNSENLISFAFQIARGMDYLISKRCIHRDLAARNILVSSDFVMKIADFGLARDLQLSEYYRKDQNNLLPVKWMAPEALENQKFTWATDVWSYGVLLWEIMSYGADPYESMNNIVGLTLFLSRGERLVKPDNCSDYIYEIMQSCWNINPELRPNFSQILYKLRSLIENNISYDDYLEVV